jgi:CMP-N-acetylneuraminic acid synthetase
MGNQSLIAMIPARMGSKRITQKNIRYLADKPLIMHILDLVLASNEFESIWVNSESDLIGNIAQKHNVCFHKRPAELSTDTATNRDFTCEFLRNHVCDYVIMVNSTSPTLKIETIKAFCDFVRESNHDTVLSTISEQAETFFQGKPLNFDFSEKVNSQLLPPTKKVVWALTAWKRDTFLSLNEKGKNPVYGGSVGTFDIPKDEACDLDTEDDWKIAEGILKSRQIKVERKYYE